MTRFASKILAVTILLLLLCSFALPQTQSNTTVYIYDELGRLKAIITPSGDAAVYAYDAAGNILSITRQLSTTVSIIEFTPDEGPSGTSVTIYGTGFSLTAAQNSVSFNGVNGTVSAASATQLTAVVPAGATTGPITVTTPNGSAVTTNDFEVLQSLSITGFTPTIGTPGTAVQITGTDFDPVASNNQLKFNITTAVASAATATTINTTVPTGATSGHITVTTTAGTAVSSGDFFVPPSPFTAASVDFASRMAIGETRQVSVTAANRIAMIVFDGSAGQRIALQASGSTISSSTVRVIKPDGSNLFNPTSLSGQWFIDTLTLPVTATYTVVVDPNSTFTGSMNLTIHNVPADATATITAGGPAVTVTTITPGQNANLTFTGTVGQRISLDLTNVTINNSAVTVRKPDGTTLVSAATVSTSGFFFDVVTLPVSGTYSIFIDPKVTAVGSMTVTLYSVPADLTGPIVIGGPPVLLTFTAPGQNALLTFTGTAGQIIEIDWFGDVGFSTSPRVNKPDGTVLFDTYGGQSDDDVYQLPVTGSYTIFIDPFFNQVGSTNIYLYEIPQPVRTSIVADGPPITVTIPTAGQIAEITFEGVAGQRVSLEINNVKVGQDWAWLELRGPNGAYVGDEFAYPEWMFDGGFLDTDRLIDTVTLPLTGSYTITVYPGYFTSGKLDLALYNVPPDVTATILPNGVPLTVTTTVPGQDARITFAGTAGQRISLKVTDAVYPYSDVRLLKPDGTELSNFGFFTEPPFPGEPPDGFEDAFVLPTTGTYTIFVDNYLGWAGSTTMSLYDVPAPFTGTASIGGPPTTITAPVGQDGELTFSGTAGQRISMKVTGPLLADVSIVGPTGTTLAPIRFIRQIGPDQAELFETLVLPSTGTHKIKIDTWHTPGTYTFYLYQVPPDVSDGVISIGGSPVTLTSTAERQNRTLTFTGTAGQVVHLKINSNNSWLNLVSILRPDGILLDRRLADNAAGKVIPGRTLPSTGTYTILTELFASGDSVTLTLGEGQADVTGTLQVDGPPVDINVPMARQLARYTFNGTAGQRVALQRSNITMRRGSVSSGAVADQECCFQDLVHGGQPAGFSVYQLLTTGPSPILVTPRFDHIGSATVQLSNVPADLSGTITINGPPVVLTTSPGQNAMLSFDGATGQQVTLRVNNNTIGKIQIEITRPTGIQQSYCLDSGTSFDLATQILPTPGTYWISVNPWRGNSGTVTISATSP